MFVCSGLGNPKSSWTSQTIACLRLGALLANPGVNGPVGDSADSVPTKGYLNYCRPRLTTAIPVKSVVPKLLCLAAVGRKCFFFPLNLPLQVSSHVFVWVYFSLSYQKSYDAALQLELFLQPPLYNSIHFSKPPTPCF